MKPRCAGAITLTPGPCDAPKIAVKRPLSLQTIRWRYELRLCFSIAFTSIPREAYERESLMLNILSLLGFSSVPASYLRQTGDVRVPVSIVFTQATLRRRGPGLLGAPFWWGVVSGGVRLIDLVPLALRACFADRWLDPPAPGLPPRGMLSRGFSLLLGSPWLVLSSSVLHAAPYIKYTNEL